jgi:phosphoglucomutase
MARSGRDPGEIYASFEKELNKSYFDRVDAPASTEQKKRLSKLTPEQIKSADLAGEPIVNKLTNAPGNGASIGGLKVVAANGWFAARPSGTEDIYKIYAESFKSEDHLRRILTEAQAIVDAAVGTPGG